MKLIPIKNERVKSFLDEFKIALDNCSPLMEHDNVESVMRLTSGDSHHPTSDDYLRNAIVAKRPSKYYFPCDANLLEQRDAFAFARINKVYVEQVDKLLSLRQKFIRKMGLQKYGVIALYPKEGYIGWHNNANAYGYNVIFTYSEDGDGWFKYRDIETGEVVTLQDKPGWSAKMGYFPGDHEVDSVEELFWHTAWSKNKRYTIGFVLDDLQMWEHLEKIITRP